MSIARIPGLPRFRTVKEARSELGCRSSSPVVLLREYRQRFGDRVVGMWEAALARKLSGIDGPAMPTGFFGRHLAGRFNGCLIFQRAAKSDQYLGLHFDQSTRTIPSELFKGNQPTFLANRLVSLPGKSPPGNHWDNLLRRLFLLQLVRANYDRSVYNAFADPLNYGWAFDYDTAGGLPIPEGQHFHWSDFPHRVMWGDLSPGSPAEREILHVIRQHWGIVVYDSATNKIDRRLFPDQHKQLLAEISEKLGVPVASFYELMQVSFNGLITSEAIKGQPGRILALAAPQAFAPEPGSKKRKSHLRVHWYKVLNPFSNNEEKREAFLHEIAVAGIAEKDVPRICTKVWFRKVNLEACLLEKGEQIAPLTFFRTVFPDKFRGGVWHEGDFPAVGVAGQSDSYSFRRLSEADHKAVAHFEGLKFFLPKEYIGRTIRRVSANHAIIYKKRILAASGGNTVEWVPDKVLVFPANRKELRAAKKRTMYVTAEELLDVKSPHVPDPILFEKLIAPILVKEGISPHLLDMGIQQAWLEIYQRRGALALAPFLASRRVKTGQ